MQLGIFAKTFDGAGPGAVLAAVAAAGFTATQYNMTSSGLPPMPSKIPVEKVNEVAEAARAAGVRIVAHLSFAEGTRPPSIIELKAFCGEHLPGYMSPDRFDIRDRLPRTSTDKVDYQSLRASAAG